MAKQPNGQPFPATKDDSGTNRLRMEGNKDGVRNFGNQRRMISELERINALNLEPSLPKQDDGSRNVSRLNQNRENLKSEFQNFLKGLQSNDSKKQPNAAPTASAHSDSHAVNRSGPTGSNTMNAPQKQQSLPPQGNGPQMPQFFVNKAASQDCKNLGGILDAMLQQASSTSPDTVGPDWPEAKGPSFHDVLGDSTALKQQSNPQMPPQNHDQQQPNMQHPGGRTHNNNSHANNNGPRPQQPPDQMQNVRPMAAPQQNMGGPPQGYVAMPGPPGQGGQQMMISAFPGQPGGPQGQMMLPQGMMQGQNMMVMGQPGMFAPNQQMPGMMPQMMVAGQQGGQMPQGMMQGMPQMGSDGQQGQMMFVPMMMSPDQAQYMNPQGMQQGYPPQQPGGPNQQQQGGYMMQQNPHMFPPQGQN